MPKAKTKGTHRSHGPLPLGDEGVDLTVEAHMVRLAVRDADSPEIRAIASRIERSCEDPSGSESGDHCRIWGAFKAVVDTVTYVNDPATAEHITAPKYLMTTKPQGDCDCMSTALASILMALGYRTQFKVIAWRSDSFTHVYLEVWVPSKGIWMPLDPVFQVPGDKYHGFGQEKDGIRRKKLYPVSEGMSGLAAVDPASAVATQIITNAGTTLQGPTRTYMKASDVDYARRLIRESATRRLTSTELEWLQRFARYYAASNLDIVKRDAAKRQPEPSGTTPTGTTPTGATPRGDTDAVATTDHESRTPWLLYAGLAAMVLLIMKVK